MSFAQDSFNVETLRSSVEARDKLCSKLYSARCWNAADIILTNAQSSVLKDRDALIQTETGLSLTWKELKNEVEVVSVLLRTMGLNAGDTIITTLPFSISHVVLILSAWRMGIIISPLDQRVKASEILQCINVLHPKAYFFEVRSGTVDFSATLQTVKDSHEQRHTTPMLFCCVNSDTTVLHDTAPSKPACSLRGQKVLEWTSLIAQARANTVELGRASLDTPSTTGGDDPCLVIFTTGSTGHPKAAVLSHNNVVANAVVESVNYMATWCDLSRRPFDLRAVVNLPPSHVGGTTEQLYSTMFAGGTCLLMKRFDAKGTLAVVQKYKATLLGQIPACFEMQWRLPDYHTFDLSSLRYVQYGGQAASSDLFLRRLAGMAPFFGTQYGLTECAGAVVISPLYSLTKGDESNNPGLSVDTITAGFCMSSLSPVTIRAKMRDNGRAGEVLPPGSIGEVCFSGPQVFLGYANNEMETKKVLSVDGVCYTGDIGSYDNVHGLKLVGRSKWCIKPKGFQVFPGEVEDYFMHSLPDILTAVACVGAPHAVQGEAVVLFVAKLAHSSLSDSEVITKVRSISQGIASYKRPSLVIVLPSIPLNRVDKVDYALLQDKAKQVIHDMRQRGEWDVHSPKSRM